jgi:hypothetical protein
MHNREWQLLGVRTGLTKPLQNVKNEKGNVSDLRVRSKTETKQEKKKGIVKARV